MKFKNLISLIMATVLFSTSTSFAAVIGDDNVDLGKATSTGQKSITFKGPAKNKLGSTQAGVLSYDGNAMSLGNGTGTGNKILTFNKGANSPSIQFNTSTNTLQFSNDNVNFTDIGTGSGSGSGIQILTDGDFEKTPITTAWTASAGTFTAVTSGGNFSGFGKQSFSWTPAAASNTLTSTAVAIPNGLYGSSGFISLYYKTASSLHKLQFYDGTTVIKEMLLPASTQFGLNGMQIVFPTSGSVSFRILSGDTTPIYGDVAYLGSYNSFIKKSASNKLANPDVESGNVNEWKCFSSGLATTRPSDGMTFAGSPTVTMTASNTAPIYGTYSAVFTKTAANSQGQGCYQDFKIEDGDLGKVLNIEAEYKVTSGTFTAGDKTTDSDLIWYVYDVDASKVIEPSNFKFISNSSNYSDKYAGSFAPVVNSSKNYRVFFYVPNTAATAFTLKLDNFKVSRITNSAGPVLSDWQTYTPTVSGFGTTTGGVFRYKRIGDTVEIEGGFTVGTPTATTGTITLPPGVVAPADSYLGSQNVVGVAATSVNDVPLVVLVRQSVNPNVLFFGYSSSTAASLTIQNGNAISATSGSFTFNAKLRVPTLAGGTTFSADANSSVPVVAHATIAGTTAITTSTTNVGNLTNIVSDSLGGWNASVYTVQAAGYYRVTASVYAVASGGGNLQTGVSINGSNYVVGSILITNGNASTASGSYAAYFKVGDQLRLTASIGAGTATVQGSYSTHLIIEKTGGGNGVIAASDPVYMVATSAAGQSIPNNGVTTVTFGTKEEDNTGSYNTSTGEFTAPAAGLYSINATATLSIGLTKAYQVFAIIQKNATVIMQDVRNGTTNSNQSSVGSTASTTVRLVQGDKIILRMYQVNGDGTAKPLTSNAVENRLSIHRVGL